MTDHLPRIMRQEAARERMRFMADLVTAAIVFTAIFLLVGSQPQL